ncbi:MAG TPA: hypothetical protein VF676_01215 [Flavobacterium sp.]|jgi:hypothetical protein
MADKSKNKEQDTAHAQVPQHYQEQNPVDKRFWDADDAEPGSDSTTGSGISEAERAVHDGHSPQKPADPNQDTQ